MERQLKEYLNELINIGTPTGARDAYGRVGTFTAISARAKVDYDVVTVTTPDGEEVTTTHLIITETEVTFDQVVWLPQDASADPSGFPPSLDAIRIPRMIEKLFNRYVVDHYEIRV